MKHSDDELATQLDALYAACEVAMTRLEAAGPDAAAPSDLPNVLERLIEFAEVSADRVALAADLELQTVLDALRGDVARGDLIRLARVVVAKLDEVELAIEAALVARERACDDIERWIESIAVADHHARADLAAAARARVAACRDERDSHDAVVFEYRELRDRLRDVGRLILARS